MIHLPSWRDTLGGLEGPPPVAAPQGLLPHQAGVSPAPGGLSPGQCPLGAPFLETEIPPAPGGPLLVVSPVPGGPPSGPSFLA